MKAHSEDIDIGNYRMSRHAHCRLRQRGMSQRQIELVMAHGEPVDKGYVMTKKAADRRIAELKREMELIDRAVNVSVVDLNGTIVTAYRVGDRRSRSGHHK